MCLSFAHEEMPLKNKFDRVYRLKAIVDTNRLCRVHQTDQLAMCYSLIYLDSIFV
jgi:hypothetical protein